MPDNTQYGIPNMDYSLIQKAESLSTGENAHAYRPLLSLYSYCVETFKEFHEKMTEQDRKDYLSLIPLFASAISKGNASRGDVKLLVQLRAMLDEPWRQLKKY